jgi:hypothetical protein
MPTRPVTWELDVPPASLLKSAKKSTSAKEVPSLDELRASLLGTRFEILKISTFAAFLIALVALAIHGSQLASADNQFAANTAAAARGLLSELSSRAASLRGRTAALAVTATHKAGALAVQGVASSIAISHSSPAEANEPAKPAMPAMTRIARARRQTRAATEMTSLPRHHSVGTIGRVPVAPKGGDTSGATDFVAADVRAAGQRVLGVMQGGIELSGLGNFRSTSEGAFSSFGSHFDITNPNSVSIRNPSSLLTTLVSPESLFAAMAALMIYMVFVVILVRVRGGLRSYGRQAV